MVIAASLSPTAPAAQGAAAAACPTSSASARSAPALFTSPPDAPIGRDDFLRAAMRTLMVVSPLQTRSRSLTHIAALDMDAGRPDRLVVPPASDNRHHTLRRQNFTSRSQLSSSEYFFVTFELPGAAEGTPDAPLKDEEYIVAAKGTTLEEALVGACHRRGISLSSVSVFLDRVELSLHAESTVLAGKQLRIRPKQDGKSSRALTRAATSQQPQLRKSSSSVRNNRRFFSTSTEDASFASPQADLLDPEKGKTAKARQRWSLFGNNKDTKMGALSEQLDNFTKYGIPKEHKSTETDERLYHLEDNWRGLLDGSDTLPERLQQQQDAVWELLQTELAYIRTLTVVKDVFLACLSSLQEARILTEVDKGRLFGNIVDIHAANAFFWEQFLAPVVAAARDGRQPLNPSHLLEGFLKFEEIFRPYVQYCVEQAECSKYCRERTADGELFTVYLAWCETHEETHVACNRLQLVDILVMPMQRLTRYSLLLKAILKKTDCEEQSKDLKFMIRKVDDFVNSVNSKLREREDQDKLNAIIARMEPYDVVESKDEDLDKMVKLHSLLDLTRPMPDCPAAQRRYLLQEGDLRLRDLNSSKADVHCFLFTDMLLVCKSKKGESRTARVRVLRPPYLVERLVINELARDQPTLACVYLNEYKVVVSAFLLTSADGKVIKRWAEDIRKAQRLYAQAKEAGATSASTAPPQYHAPPLSLSRQPSSLYDEDLVLQGDDAPEADTHSYASYSLGLYPHHRSPRGSTRGSSLNHSHSGSVEMNEASSLSSVSHSRGISVDNNELRASSLSSDEGIPPLGADQAGAGAGHPGGGGAGPGGGPGGGARGLRRSQHSKSPSPNTLSIQVPVFSNLGQSLPNLNLAASSPHGSLSGPTPPCSLLLVPPTGKGGLHHHHQHHGPLSPGHRGTSYPPPSPPRGSLHRWTPQRNPPLMKMRHVSASVSSQQSCSGPAPPGVTWAAPAASAAAAPAAAAPSGPQPGPGAQQGSPTSTPMPSNFDFDVPLIGGVSPPAGEAAAQQSAQGGGAAGAAAGGAGPGQQPSPTSRQTFMMKRLTRGDNRRYHTAGTIDDVKKAEGRDATIHKRFSWNYGPQSCGKRQSSGHEDGAQGQQDVLLIDRATSPLKPPPQHITDAAWSRVHAGSTERTNSFPEPVQFQSPSVGSSPSVSLCGDCPPCCGPGAGPGPPPAAANVVASVTSSPALSTTSPVQLPSLNTSPTTCPDAGLELASSNPFLEDVVGQDEPLPSTHGFPSDEVLVLITDAQVEYTDA
ncbi:pleckstrin homology domain-containing family G member 5 isoform X2 [Frankliniella occidentalis]|uniref:Pleckstrin homology domain-containing family G member 5 isoform X2 n=1 Tax=Frankliniella occidentalis TaxID=133901 RepID=A0A9C6U3H0_FRAOC|nr:pleckstrin homology domain-containing family G member 5 isoform X2 [Frankliniella occidentalis]